MASFRDLERQRNTVRNQGRVFSALQTVSGVKFRRAEARVGRARPYADNMEEMMREIARKSTSNNPLMAGRGESRSAIVATLTADRGLCGGFNAQVLRTTMRLRQEKGGTSGVGGGAELKQVASGRKAEAFFRFRRIPLLETFSGFSDAPEYSNAQQIGDYLTRAFEREEADEVYLVYNRFQSALVQQPTVTRLLPVAPGVEAADEESGGGEWSSNLPFEYVDDADTVLSRLIPRYVDTVIFQALLESAAGEHGARMTAMKNATDNANDLSERLTMQMNKARQAQITQEILEIASGAEALSTG
ncbi:ATP synthase F1 subunit gamma [Rubrobacter aplysinae]|uniref:ATP synthase F1 subunit gamma n=1 Tax=Rubrobacter aplysinae TaxID=909625 RepID=UPI00064B890A|nr:ATP synthase F1 subunit gamma [Rubrobacter aplysinae]